MDAACICARQAQIATLLWRWERYYVWVVAGATQRDVNGFGFQAIQQNNLVVSGDHALGSLVEQRDNYHVCECPSERSAGTTAGADAFLPM